MTTEAATAPVTGRAAEWTYGPGEPYDAAVSTRHSDAVISTGDYSSSAATGDFSLATATGDYSAATATGYRGAARAEGCQVAALVTGDRATVSAKGDASVAVSAGHDGRAMAAEGCGIAIFERADDGSILSVFAGVAGRDGLKPMTWYACKGGKAVEVGAATPEA